MTELKQYINSYFGVTGEEMSLIASLFKRVTLTQWIGFKGTALGDMASLCSILQRDGTFRSW